MHLQKNIADLCYMITRIEASVCVFTQLVKRSSGSRLRSEHAAGRASGRAFERAVLLPVCAEEFFVCVTCAKTKQRLKTNSRRVMTTLVKTGGIPQTCACVVGNATYVSSRAELLVSIQTSTVPCMTSGKQPYPTHRVGSQ